MDEMGKAGSLYLFLKRVAELAVVEALGKPCEKGEQKGSKQ